MNRISEAAPDFLEAAKSSATSFAKSSIELELREGFAAQPLAQFLPLRSLFLITGLFWIYITASNILYARGMRANMAQYTQLVMFSPWGERAIQHLQLFPLLVGCYWASLRVGWRKLYHILFQGGLAAAFASLSYPAMDVAERFYYTYIVPMPPPTPEQIRVEAMTAHGALWTTYFTTFLLTYGFGLALVTGFAFYRRYHEAELRMSALEREWGAARLSALRMQLSPHTLFNLLHTIRGQINFDPQAAREMVVQLADLLRRLLGAGQREFCLLSEELRFVQLYLELQRQRFSDRLTVHLPEADAQPVVWVPSLILQPLVENAVVHGLAGHEGPVEVCVEILLSADTLTLRVINGVASDRTKGREGIGLSNVRERLQVQFGRRAQFDAGPIEPMTWVAQVQIPALREVSLRRKEAVQVLG